MREKNQKYKRIGERLIRSLDEFEDIRGVKIAYLSSDEEKKKDRKVVYADCTKVESKYKWAVPYDFFITIYEPNCLEFTEEQFEILLRHELHHVGVNTEGTELSFFVIPHDVEEFRIIIDEHGIDWTIAEKEE